MSFFLICDYREHGSVLFKRTNAFSKCGTCQQLKSDTQAFGSNDKRAEAQAVRDKLTKHHNEIACERRNLYCHWDEAMQPTGRHVCYMIDGMDQQKTSIPHERQSNKRLDPDSQLKTHVIGGLIMLPERQVHAFTSFGDEYPKGTDHTFTVLLKLIKASPLPLRPICHIHLDKCVSENKNKDFFAGIQYLIHRGVFKEIHVHYLPVGHTHELIDQMFSRFSVNLQYADAMTGICKL